MLVTTKPIHSSVLYLRYIFHLKHLLFALNKCIAKLFLLDLIVIIIIIIIIIIMYLICIMFVDNTNSLRDI